MLVVDLILKPLVAPESSIDKELESLALRSEFRSQSVGDEVFEYLDVIDTKASALLGHISIFSAVAGLLLSLSEAQTWTRLALTVEFIVLLTLTFLCLRCLRLITPKQTLTTDQLVLRDAVREMLYRRRVYIFTHEVSGMVTIALIATTILEFL